jgi:hypothetical protein
VFYLFEHHLAFVLLIDPFLVDVFFALGFHYVFALGVFVVVGVGLLWVVFVIVLELDLQNIVQGNYQRMNQ